jgi:hypothetical protein
MSTAKAKPPEWVSRRRRAARARTSGRARRCGLLSPRSPTTGSCRTAKPAPWSLLEPVQIYDDHCVRWKVTLLLLELSR